MNPTAIHLIRRPKLSGLPGWHFGVAVEYLGGGAVIYDLAQGNGFRVRVLHQFLEGRLGEVVETLGDGRAVTRAMRRLNRVLNSPSVHHYHFTDRNCEHVARFIVTGERKSLQLQGAVVVAATLALAFMLGREAA